MEETMPLVIVKMLDGRTVEQKRQMAAEITETVVRVAGTTIDQVDVVFEDYPKESWAKAGTLFSDK
jgi:4-oxalocrotonate tautomerase